MDVFKPVADLRRKDLFDSRTFTATRIEFRRGTETLAFDKSKGKDDKEIWKNAAGKEVDATKADDLLSRMFGLRADSFVGHRAGVVENTRTHRDRPIR